MKKIFLLLIVSFLLIAVPAQSQDADAVFIELEMSFWEAWKKGDRVFFESNMAEDAVSIGANGIVRGKKAVVELEIGQPCEVNSYSMSDWHVLRIAPGVVMVSFTAKQDATCGGVKNPPHIAASSTYVKRDGKWLNVVYCWTVLSN
jgi:hypothetical protein